MNASAWIALATLTLAGLGFVIGLFKYFTGQIDNLRKEQNSTLSQAIKEGDEKRGRIYERLDDAKKTHKDEIEVLRKEVMEDFVNAKVFGLVTGNTERMVEELKKAISDIDKKLDKLIENEKHLS